jgi:ABC-type microcin C transport system permease subunit YejB
MSWLRRLFSGLPEVFLGFFFFSTGLLTMRFFGSLGLLGRSASVTAKATPVIKIALGSG